MVDVYSTLEAKRDGLGGIKASNLLRGRVESESGGMLMPNRGGN